MPEVTQQVVGNEVARCSGPFTLTAPGRREGRRRAGRRRDPSRVGSGPGQEGEGQKYLCSHLNVNQVWLEQGSRDRGGRSKREPDRREEAEMGVVRGRGRGQRERAREPGSAGDTGNGV